MKQIVIISRSEAIRHLRSLDPSEVVDLETPGAVQQSTVELAIEVIVRENVRLWAADSGRLKWTVGELLQEFGPQPGDRVSIRTREATGTIERIDSKGVYEVSIDGAAVVIAMRDELEVISTGED